MAYYRAKKLNFPLDCIQIYISMGRIMRIKVNDRPLKISRRFLPRQGAFNGISPSAIAVRALNNPRRALSGPIYK